jgi:hypothetical protein
MARSARRVPVAPGFHWQFLLAPVIMTPGARPGALARSTVTPPWLPVGRPRATTHVRWPRHYPTSAAGPDPDGAHTRWVYARETESD